MLLYRLIFPTTAIGIFCLLLRLLGILITIKLCVNLRYSLGVLVKPIFCQNKCPSFMKQGCRDHKKAITFCNTEYSKEQRRDNSGRPSQPELLQIEEGILEMVVNDATMTTGVIAAQVEVSHRKIWTPFRQEQYYHCHYQRVQALQHGGHPKRVEFRQWHFQNILTKMKI